jgi:hypothetical protein
MKRRRTTAVDAEIAGGVARYWERRCREQLEVYLEQAAKHAAELEANPPADAEALRRKQDAGIFLERAAQFYREEIKAARLAYLASLLP